jgi:DNA-binding CsgD family transcriptional regulator
MQLGSDWLYWVQAQLLALVGEQERALQLLELVAQVGAAVGSAVSPLLVAPDLVRLAVSLDQPDRAAAALALCAAVPTQVRSPLTWGLRWAQALAAGDATGVECAAEGLSATRPFESACAWHDALALWPVADAVRAREAAAAALKGYESCRAEAAIARLRADARRFGLKMRAGRPAEERIGWGSITATERLVVDLVAEGCTNAEIAMRLFMSRRTVESHLVHVYTKVGVRSRVELALQARERLSV